MGRCRGSAPDRGRGDRGRAKGQGRLIPSRAWRWCFFAGLATLAIAIAFGRIPDLVPCGPSGGAGAVIAFELARNAGDVVALFGTDPCRAALIAAQRSALWLDLLGFIPAYALFLLGAVVALRRANLGLALVAFNLVMIAATFDLIEGLILFRILGELPGTERSFTGLFWMVRGKFALLALAEVMLAVMLWRGWGLAKVAAGAMAAGGVVALVTLFTDPHDPMMMRGHMVAWSALLAAAAWGTLRRPAAIEQA